MTTGKKEATPPETPASVTPIKKSGAFSLEKFKSKRADTIAGVETLTDGMPHQKLSEVKDFFRLHPSEEDYWSPELCFVMVPIKGQKRDTLHLIDEEIALKFLPSGRIQRFRLALATKPYDLFFLAHVPSRNLDNGYNSTATEATEQAKTLWTSVASRKDEGIEAYKVDSAHSQDAFPEPRWPSLSLDELIGKAFVGRMIETEDSPPLLRLIGAKQNLK
jgi:hypothetical protein